MSTTPPRRAPASIVLAALLAACAEHVSAPPTDAGAPVVDIVAIDVTALDGPMVDRPVVDRPRSDVGFDLGAPDAGVDAAVRLEVPVDPLAVPAPGSECTSDASVRAGDPTIDPPRPIVPQSVSRVTSQRPSFRWALPAGTTGARVEVCADRCCTRVIATLDADGTTVRPSAALPPGVVFWRMFGRAGGATGSRASYTWEFEVRRRDTPVDSSWGTIRDFTGDGYDDLLVLSSVGLSRANQPLQIIEGGSSGPRTPRLLTTLPEVTSGKVGLGDFNGDGLADLAYRGGASNDIGNAFFVVSSERGASPHVTAIRASRARRVVLTGPCVVDWNGDGYSDLILGAVFYGNTFGVAFGSAVLLFRGSPAGIADVPQAMFDLPDSISRPLVGVLEGIGDVDGDGFGDLFVEDSTPLISGSGKHIALGRDDDSFRVVDLADPVGSSGRVESGVYPRSAGDIDGDSRIDLTVRGVDPGELLVYLNSLGFNDVSVAISEPEHPGGGWGGFANEWTVGDLNGDGYSDLLVTSPGSYTEVRGSLATPYNTGRLYVFAGGRGGVGREVTVFGRASPNDVNENPMAFALWVSSPGDLNADGIDDAAVVDSYYGTVCVIDGRLDLIDMSIDRCLSVPGYADSEYGGVL